MGYERPAAAANERERIAPQCDECIRSNPSQNGEVQRATRRRARDGKGTEGADDVERREHEQDDSEKQGDRKEPQSSDDEARRHGDPYE